MVTNKEVRKITGMGTLEKILRRNRLRWMGHINRMDGNRLVKAGSKLDSKGRQKKKRQTKKELEGDHNRGFKDDRHDMGGRGGDCWRPDCVEQLCCPMCRRHADGLRSKVG